MENNFEFQNMASSYDFSGNQIENISTKFEDKINLQKINKSVDIYSNLNKNENIQQDNVLLLMTIKIIYLIQLLKNLLKKKVFNLSKIK